LQSKHDEKLRSGGSFSTKKSLQHRESNPHPSQDLWLALAVPGDHRKKEGRKR